MDLIVLGSSSTGNGYLLRASSGEGLVIETGISLMRLKEANDFDLSMIRGALISHSHADHSGRIMDYLSAGIRCHTSSDTIAERGISSHNLIPVQEMVTYDLGEFKFMPFALEHDVRCMGYLIRHDECGQVVFITDTLYSYYRFKGLNQIIVEANYSEAILEDHAQSGTVIPKVRDRVIGSHMSLETCREFLRSNDLSRVRNIILIHLSSTNSNASQFRDEIQQLTGRSVHVATAGLRVNLNLNPF